MVKTRSTYYTANTVPAKKAARCNKKRSMPTYEEEVQEHIVKRIINAADKKEALDQCSALRDKIIALRVFPGYRELFCTRVASVLTEKILKDILVTCRPADDARGLLYLLTVLHPTRRNCKSPVKPDVALRIATLFASV